MSDDRFEDDMMENEEDLLQCSRPVWSRWGSNWNRVKS